MDRQDREIAAEAATELCEAADRRAAEVGLYAGRVTAFLQEGHVLRVRVDFSDARCPHGHQSPWSSSCGCTGLAEAQARFTETLQQKLADTAVCFGNVVFVFSEGRLRRVEVTETFRIEQETTELGRIFLPHWGQAPTTRDALQGLA